MSLTMVEQVKIDVEENCIKGNLKREEIKAEIDFLKIMELIIKDHIPYDSIYNKCSEYINL